MPKSIFMVTKKEGSSFRVLSLITFLENYFKASTSSAPALNLATFFAGI